MSEHLNFCDLMATYAVLINPLVIDRIADRRCSMTDVADANVFVWLTSLGCLAIIFLTDPLIKRCGINVGERLRHTISVGLVALLFAVSATFYFF